MPATGFTMNPIVFVGGAFLVEFMEITNLLIDNLRDKKEKK